MARQVVEKTETKDAASADARDAPTIKSHALQWQHEGFVWREAFVRLPEGVILQDLHDVPTIWKNVQAVRQTALKRFDKVTAVSHDESWAIQGCMVIDADATRVTLSIKPGDVIRFPSKGAQWEDGLYRIAWSGSGYGVFRKSDGVPMLAANFASIDAARAEVFRSLYSRQVG